MNPLKRYAHRGANKVLHSFKCEICHHSVVEHKRALPKYEKYSNKELGMMIQQELNLKKRTLPFCHILICDMCKVEFGTNDMLTAMKKWQDEKPIIRLCGHESTALCGCTI